MEKVKTNEKGNVRTYGVGGLNPNFKVAPFEGLHSELHFKELAEGEEGEGQKRQRVRRKEPETQQRWKRTLDLAGSRARPVSWALTFAILH